MYKEAITRNFFVATATGMEPTTTLVRKQLKPFEITAKPFETLLVLQNHCQIRIRKRSLDESRSVMVFLTIIKSRVLKIISANNFALLDAEDYTLEPDSWTTKT